MKAKQKLRRLRYADINLSWFNNNEIFKLLVVCYHKNFFEPAVRFKIRGDGPNKIEVQTRDKIDKRLVLWVFQYRLIPYGCIRMCLYALCCVLQIRCDEQFGQCDCIASWEAMDGAMETLCELMWKSNESCEDIQNGLKKVVTENSYNGVRWNAKMRQYFKEHHMDEVTLFYERGHRDGKSIQDFEEECLQNFGKRYVTKAIQHPLNVTRLRPQRMCKDIFFFFLRFFLSFSVFFVGSKLL